MDIHQRYRIVQELEPDWVGKVFLVEDTWQTDKQLLLKWIPAGRLNEQARAQLRYEFAAIAQLSHPNLAAFYDFGFSPEAQAYFYTMENVTGETLKAYAARHRSATPEDYTWLYSIAIPLTQALHYIHTRGLLHLAVHPANIRITPQGQVKLMDFALIGEVYGMAAWHLRGLPACIAPEMIRGEAVDARADLYALGVTLYECLTGHPPFKADPTVQVLRHHLETSPASAFPAAVPQALRQLVLSLLAKEPGQRPESASAVLHTLYTLSGMNHPAGSPNGGNGYFQSFATIGREAALERMDEVLTQAIQGGPQLVLITGAEGMGKSRLLRELALHAHFQGFLVGEVDASTAPPVPYALWRELLRQALSYRHLTPEEGLRLYGPLLAALLPELDAGAALEWAGTESALEAVFALVDQVIQSLDWPVTILIDEAQQADSASLALLAYLLEHMEHARLLIALALDPTALPAEHPLQAWLQSAAFPVLALSPLTLEEVKTWLRLVLGLAEVDPALAEYLHALSGGCPRDLQLALHLLREKGLLVGGKGAGWQWLSRIADALPVAWLEHLSRLEAHTRDVLQWSALLGLEPGLPLLIQASGLYPDQCFIALARAEKAGLLWRVLRQGNLTYRFASTWLQQGLMAGMEPGSRRGAFLRIAQKMEKGQVGQGTPALLAKCYAQAGQVQRAFDLYRHAARQDEALQAWEAAAQHYTQAVNLLTAQDAPDPQAYWDLLTARAAVWQKLGNLSAWAADLQALSVLAEGQPPSQQVWLLLEQARAEEALGRRLAALDLARQASQIAQDHALTPLQAEALVLQGQLLCLTDAYSEAQSVLTQARNIYVTAGDERGESKALRWLGEALRRQGNLTDAMGAYQRVLSLARWIGDLGFESDACNALGVLTQDLARKRSLFEASLRLARTLRDPQRETRAYNNLGLVYWRLGLYERARVYLEEALAIQRNAQLRGGLVFSLESLARISLALGDLEKARALIEEGREISRSLGSPLNEALYLMDRGLWLMAQGEMAAARQALSAACAGFRALGTLDYLTVAASKLALVTLALGDAEAARAASDEAIAALESHGIASSFFVQEVWYDRYLVLAGQAADVPNAPAEALAALQKALDLLLETVVSTSDAGLRRLYLLRVPLHQKILQTWQAWQGRLPLELRSSSSDEDLPDERIQRLLDLTMALQEVDDESALLDLVLEQLLELSGAERAFVFLRQAIYPDDVVCVRAYDPEGRGPDYPSLVSKVGQTRAPVWIADIKRDDRYAALWLPQVTTTRSLIGVPLMFQQTTLLGALLVEMDEPAFGFTLRDLEVLRQFAGQVACALSRVRAWSDMRSRMHDFEILRQTNLNLISSSSVEEVTEALQDAVRRFFPECREVRVFWEAAAEVSVTPYRTLAEAVMYQGQMLVITSSRHHPLLAESQDEDRAWLGVPVKTGLQVKGALIIGFPQPRSFTAHDLRVLGLLADQAAVAVESARLLQEVQQRARQLAAINAVSRDISSTLELPKVLERIAHHARNLMYADEVEIYLLDTDKQWLRPIVALGPFAEQLKRRPIRVGEGLVGYVAQTGISELVQDTSRDPRVIRIPGTPDAHALMCVALHARGELLGVIALTRAPERGAFPPDALDFMTGLAQQAAIAIENARLYWNERALREETAQMLEQQRHLEQVKDQFIQNVSHELRTPLTLVHGYAELLRSGGLGPLTPEQDEALEVIQRRAAFLGEMVTDFTLLIEIQARGLRAELLDLPPLLHETIAAVQSAAATAGLTLEVDIPPRLPKIRGNPLYLRRVFDNLMSNAVKFTPSGGQVGLRAWREDAFVCIAVSDTGIGIPPSEQERIFQRFYQVDGSSTRRHGGTGLGLAVVKEIVEAHGGTVSVKSAEGRGTVFTVRLPVAR